jgi:hypothetical protein
VDEQHNWSQLSNIARFALPVLEVHPDTVYLDTLSGESELVIRDGNEGEGRFSFQLSTDSERISFEPAHGIVDGEEVPVRVFTNPDEIPLGNTFAQLIVTTDRYEDTVTVVLSNGPGPRGRVRTLVDAWNESTGTYILVPRNVGGALVRIGPFESTTDDSGFFELTGWGEEEYVLSVTAYGCLPFDTTVVPDTQFLELTIDPSLVDYFPLRVGNRYIYEFLIDTSTVIFDVIHTEGYELWEIESCSTSVNDTTYAVRVHRMGVRSVLYSDTTFLIDEVETRTIRQEGNRVYGNFTPHDGLVRRYYPAYLPRENLEPLRSLLRLKRGVGVSGWEWTTVEVNFVYCKYDLWDWSIAP